MRFFMEWILGPLAAWSLLSLWFGPLIGKAIATVNPTTEEPCSEHSEEWHEAA